MGKAINSSQESITLAGKSTLNRIEHCPESVSSREDSRYHRIEHDGGAIEKLLVEIFLESYRKPPKQIILDLDVTDDLVHGNQESTFFNPYYRGYCYAPLYIFCGKHLLAAKLRASLASITGEWIRRYELLWDNSNNLNLVFKGNYAQKLISWCDGFEVGYSRRKLVGYGNRLLLSKDFLELLMREYNLCLIVTYWSRRSAYGSSISNKNEIEFTREQESIIVYRSNTIL